MRCQNHPEERLLDQAHARASRKFYSVFSTVFLLCLSCCLVLV